MPQSMELQRIRCDLASEQQEKEDMINYLRTQEGDSKVLIQDYINNVCREILKCTAVFKDDELGQEHLRRFVKSL